MLKLSKYSLGVGDRFAHQGEAQLRAVMLAAEAGVEVVPVWNKSHREHVTIGSRPADTRTAADAAVTALGWDRSYHVDADHINLATVDKYLSTSDFFTIDVADSIGTPDSEPEIEAFVDRHPELVGLLEIVGIERSLETTRESIVAIASKYLAAVKQAGEIYRHIETAKTAGTFITEVSMDETDQPQTPLELLVILAAIADEGIPIQTIAPKFTGRFNKGVDYVGDVTQFAKEFDEDLAVIAHAVEQYELPENLKLSVHSGSDKFSIYAAIRAGLKKHDTGVHVKTAGTTWLEELIGMAEAGGEGLQLAKEIYREALAKAEQLCEPYATVIDIDRAALPSAEDVNGWTSEDYVAALRHDPSCEAFNSSFRQLLHVGYKIAAQMGDRYVNVLESCQEPIARNVTENHFERHIKPLFLALLVLLCLWAPNLSAAELAMGFRVGEVSQDSAIVWSRVTKHAERNWDGVPSPKERPPKVDEYVPSRIKVADREGAVPGAEGQLRLLVSENEDFSESREFGWASVDGKSDYTHQFHVNELRPSTKYFVKVEARSEESSQADSSLAGSFQTAAMPDQWQDVSFGVVTGKYYAHLDDREGFHIYPAMSEARIDFLIPTGDTVYYDSEEPRARTVELARFHWHRMYSLPRHVEFHRHVPAYFEKDDHDTLSDDCWPSIDRAWMKPMTFKQGLALFREQVPMGEKTYRTYRWGKGLQIWLVEGRDFRSANPEPDGPEKTIWGKQQMAWLKKTILESDAKFRVLISPTPIIGPDKPSKADNHANPNFAYEGNHFRSWTRDQQLENFYVCCGDRHWQYLSIDPKTQLHEFSCGPASDEHAKGSPGHDPVVQPFHREKGGFLSVSVSKEEEVPTISFRHHDVHGRVVHEYRGDAVE